MLAQLLEQKGKLIIIVLGALCLILLIFSLLYANRFNSLQREYHQLEKEKQTLIKENNVLAKKIVELQAETNKVKEHETQLAVSLESVNAELTEHKSRLLAITDERDKISEKLQQVLSEKSHETKAEPVRRPLDLEEDQYWAGVLEAKADLEVQLVNLRNMLKEAQIKSDEMIKNKSVIELDLKKVMKDEQDMQRLYEYSERTSANLSMQLYKEKQDRMKLMQQLSLFKEENQSLRFRIKDLMNKKISLEKKLKEAEDKGAELSRRLAQMGSALEDKMASYYEIKEDIDLEAKAESNSPSSSVELPPIVVRSGPGIETPTVSADKLIVSDTARPKGKIIGINQENNFVILDIGSSQGVKKGMLFYVISAGSQIAALEIIQVRAGVSAADIKEKIAPIKVGDAIR